MISQQYAPYTEMVQLKGMMMSSSGTLGVRVIDVKNIL